MTDRGRQPATYQDLLDLPPNVVGEIVAGELYASPRPAASHAHAQTGLGGDLHAPFGRGRGGPGGWWILFEPELHLAGDVMVPDLAGWRRSRMPVIPDVAAFELAPDWVCEVVSPGTARLDRTLKLPRYAAAGVTHAWVVDPRARTLEVFRNTQGSWLLVSTHSRDDIVQAEPFDAVPLELSGLWLPRAPA